MIDSTMIRAHQHSVGARKNIDTDMQEQELGRLKSGFSAKIHSACDIFKKFSKIFITPDQKTDYVNALSLIKECK